MLAALSLTVTTGFLLHEGRGGSGSQQANCWSLFKPCLHETRSLSYSL